MKLQIAIDRMSIEEAIEIVEAVKEYADIIEIGTSFFKDYGLDALVRIRAIYDGVILADIKTIDETAYEFQQFFSHGADILTIMGAASIDSIKIAEEVTKKYGKQMMIDLLELSDDKIRQMEQFDDAILSLHLPIDSSGRLDEYLISFNDKFKFKQTKAAAGGITLETIPLVKQLGIDIAIVGSGITGADDIVYAAKQFKEAIR